MIGGGVGFSWCFRGGISSGDDEGWFISFSKEDKAAIFGTGLGVLGSALGTLIGTERRKFRINGNIENYENELKAIQRYSLISTD